MKKFLSTFLIVLMLFCSLSVFAVAEDSSETSIPVDTESALYQKRVLFCGDSICEASNDADGYAKYGGRGWAGRIMAWNDMAGSNKGKSAASVSDCRGTNTILAQLKAQAMGNYDFVILHGGVNDAWDNAPVGVMTEGFDGPFDESTYAGGLEASIKYAKETYEGAQLGYILNFSLPSATWGSISDMSEYFDMAKAVCDKWDVPYLDLYSNEDFNKNVLKTHLTTYIPDTVHPNSAGYDIISPLINDWMKEIAVAEDASQAVSSEPVAESNASSQPDESKEPIPVHVYSIAVMIVAIVTGAVIIIVAKRKK